MSRADRAWAAKAFVNNVNACGYGGMFLQCQPQETGALWITVSDRFELADYRARLVAAKWAWRLWALVVPGNDPRMVRIELMDTMGNTVGGSKFLNGSDIWVEK